MLENYISAREAADRLGVDHTRVRVYLKQNRIPGAVKHNGMWFIPVDFTVEERKHGSKLSFSQDRS